MQTKITPLGWSTAQNLLLQIPSWSKEVFLPAGPFPNPTDPKVLAWVALVVPILSCLLFSTTSSCFRMCLNPQGFQPAFFPPSLYGFYRKKPPRESCWMAMRVRAHDIHGMFSFHKPQEMLPPYTSGGATLLPPGTKHSRCVKGPRPSWQRAWAARREGFNCTRQSGALLVI